MEFWVSLINVTGVPDGDALKSLKGNCTHVHKDIWIMEGETECLSDDGIEFEILTEGAVPSLGGLTKKELRTICNDRLGFKV